MTRTRVILVSEFPSSSGAPTGALASDLESFLSQHKNMTVRFLHVRRAYQTGGLRVGRILNLLQLHAFTCLLLPFEWVAAKIKRINIVILVTTSPPLIQWTCSLLGRFLGVKVIIWYQDAHPEIEARAFERLNLGLPAKILRILDRLLTRKIYALVSLDQAMEDGFLRRNGFKGNCRIVPPWSTYMEPARSFRIPDLGQKINFLYAGNYGKVHDLSPLTIYISNLSKQRLARFSFSFVGMDEDSQKRIELLFKNIEVEVHFFKRFGSKSELLDFFQTFNVGIVSLSSDSGGLACPSKALSYLSQGLPILYVGPENSLSWTLCKEGWGFTVEEIFTSEPPSLDPLIASKQDTIFPNPKEWSQAQIAEIILSSGIPQSLKRGEG